MEPVEVRPSPLELSVRHEHAGFINAALACIPAEYREAVVLRFQEGMTLEEISAVTGAPLGTIKSRLYRALNLLMPLLKGAQA